MVEKKKSNVTGAAMAHMNFCDGGRKATTLAGGEGISQTPERTGEGGTSIMFYFREPP